METSVPDMEMEQEEMTCKDARQAMFCALRSSSPPNMTMADPDMDTGDELLHSMEMTASSITWDKVKKAVQLDVTSQELTV